MVSLGFKSESARAKSQIENLSSKTLEAGSISRPVEADGGGSSIAEQCVNDAFVASQATCLGAVFRSRERSDVQARAKCRPPSILSAGVGVVEPAAAWNFAGSVHQVTQLLGTRPTATALTAAA
jgi:hypothetical protein